MNAGFSMPQSRLLLSLVVPLLLTTVGCADARRGPTKTTAARPKVDAKAELQRLMRRENGPFRKHSIQLFGGLLAAEYEAASPAKPECSAPDSDGDSSCELHLSMGEDADGDANEILCLVDTTLRGPFGAVIADRLHEGVPLETPRLSVTKIGDGISAQFVTDWIRTAEGKSLVGTLKVASYFNQSYSVTCSDIAPGGRKTFDRVVGNLFKSVRVVPNPRRTSFMTAAYEHRQGDRSTGFRYLLVEQRYNDKPGSAEINIAFNLEADGKTWRTSDYGGLVARDAAGNVELYRESYSAGGQRFATLTAKPSEDRKFRLKLERGDKSDALELTPKAPLSTELWSAPEFTKVARGSRPSYRYATLGIDDSGEPTFNYVSITRSTPDILLEEVEGSATRSSKTLEGAVKDELHVLPDGSILKEVTTHSVSQRLFTWGKLPTGAGSVPASSAQASTASSDASASTSTTSTGADAKEPRSAPPKAGKGGAKAGRAKGNKAATSDRQ